MMAMAAQQGFDYSGKTIIDCPSCKTRFCIKKEVVDRHSEPNFHCSRCDHVFKVNLAEMRAHSTERTATPTPVQTKQTPIRNFNIAPTIKSETPASAPHERDIPAMTSQAAQKDLRTRRSINPGDLLKHVNIFSKKSPQIPGMPSAPAISQTKWQDLGTITTPIVIFLLALGLLSFYLVRNPGTAGSIISAIVPSAPRMTPSGLHITKTDFTKVTLDSGEQVAVVFGEIQNTTSTIYGSVNLEAQAFDREGNLIKKSMSASGGTLVNTRIQSLSPKLIEDIQTARGPRKLAIGPNRSEKFAVALMGDEVKEASYFSIRIYSVRAQS
jgi:uncharacterized C2H2 Zn-finger protein